MAEQEENELLDQFSTPKSDRPNFKECMDGFMNIIPLHQRYTKFAAYLVKSFIHYDMGLAIHTEVGSAAFHEEDNTVKYLQICRAAYEDYDKIAIVVVARPTTWEVFFGEFVVDPVTKKQEYRHMRSCGQPENLHTAFFDYRDGYLLEQHRREERQRYIDTHPDDDPKPCLKARKEEPVKPWWERLFEFFS